MKPLTTFLLVTVALVPLAAPAFAGDGEAAATTPLARVFTGLVHRVVYVDPYVYVALDTGVESFDVSNPADPIPLGNLYLPSPAYDLAVVGRTAYVANGEAGLAVLDVTDPSSIVLLGAWLPPTGSRLEARGVAVAGGIAYLAEAGVRGSLEHGLRAIDVTVSAAPAERGYMPLDNGALAVAIGSGTAFVGLGSELGGRNGVVAVDATDPSLLGEVGFVDLGLGVNRIVVDGTVALVAAGIQLVGSFVALDVSDPWRPGVLDRLPLANGPMDLSLRPGVAFVAVRESGLLAVDVSDPSDLSRLAAVPLDALAVAVYARGDSAFVGLRSSNGEAPLATVETLSTVAMEPRGWADYAEATAAAAAPGFAYLLRRDELHVFDTSSPSAPVWLAAWGEANGDYSTLDVDGRTVVVAEGRNVHVLDVTDPWGPTRAGIAQISTGHAVRVVLEGTVLYVVTGNGLEVFDLTSPAAPIRIARHDTAGMSAAFAVDGNNGYLAAGSELQVLDVSNPATPALIGLLTFPGEELRGVAVIDELLILTGLRNYLYTVDVASPTAPVLDGMLPGLGGFDVELVGDRAVIAAGTGGLRVVDVSDVGSPREDGYHDTSGLAVDLASEGTTIYLATLEAQHWITRCDSCRSMCVEDWPSIAWNSLRVAKLPVRDTFTWAYDSTVGSSNLHRTANQRELPNLWSDMGTLVDRVATTTASDTLVPAVGSIVHYRVFGSGSCTGASYP